MPQSESFFRYLPVGDSVLRWGAYVTGAGFAAIPPQAAYPPFGHPTLYHFDWRRGRTLPEFQMILINEGSGEFHSERTGEVAFHGPALFWLFPGVWHRYRPFPQTGWTERWFSFNGDLVHRLWSQGVIDPSRAVASIGDATPLVAKYDAMLKQIHGASPSRTSLQSLQVLRLLAESIESMTRVLGTESQPQSPPPPAADPLVDQALEIIHTESHRPISIEEVAEKLSIARRTLDRRFAAATGKSILEEINHFRLNRAKRLLAETDLPIRSIANLVGFSNPERLGVLFARREGVTPSEFRQRRSRSASAGAVARPSNPLRSS
jgi:AraC-like DNA-binding protein